jgi:mRNA-degrading endonuclease HigB of HigAB toxin-antitoxin module
MLSLRLSALDASFAQVQKANWKNTNDVKRNYTWASIISSDRIVFDILTKRYRLVTQSRLTTNLI